MEESFRMVGYPSYTKELEQLKIALLNYTATNKETFLNVRVIDDLKKVKDAVRNLLESTDYIERRLPLFGQHGYSEMTIIKLAANTSLAGIPTMILSSDYDISQILYRLRLIYKYPNADMSELQYWAVNASASQIEDETPDDIIEAFGGMIKIENIIQNISAESIQNACEGKIARGIYCLGEIHDNEDNCEIWKINEYLKDKNRYVVIPNNDNIITL